MNRIFVNYKIAGIRINVSKSRILAKLSNFIVTFVVNTEKEYPKIQI